MMSKVKMKIDMREEFCWTTVREIRDRLRSAGTGKEDERAKEFAHRALNTDTHEEMKALILEYVEVE